MTAPPTNPVSVPADPRTGWMKLIIRLPPRVLFEEKVSKIQARARDGWFGMRPRHIDFVSAVEPGVMTFHPLGKGPEYLAHDHGILVKCGREVTVSTRGGVRGTDLAELKKEVEHQFLALRERELAARALEAKLEAELVRHLLETQKNA